MEFADRFSQVHKCFLATAPTISCMDELFGLPAHPLLVHFPVVAIPTLALLGMALAVSPSFRERFGLATLGLGIVTMISTLLATKSGEAIKEDFFNKELIETHESLANTLRIFVFALVASIVALVVTKRKLDMDDKHPVVLVASLLVLAFSVLSAIWVIRTGHEGARLTWE